MSTTVKIDLNDKGAAATLEVLSQRFSATGSAADRLGGAVSKTQDALGKVGAGSKKLGGDVDDSSGKIGKMSDSFRRLALGGIGFQAITFAVGKFNETSKAAAAEGVEPLEISFDRLIRRVVEGQGVFAKLSGLLGKGLGSSVFEDEEKEKRLDKLIEGRKKREELQDKIISDNKNRYDDTEFAMKQRMSSQTETDASKKLKSAADVAKAETAVLAIMKRQREEADQDAVKDSFNAQSIEESNKRKDRQRQEGELKLQALFARRMELEAQHEEDLKTEVDRIHEIQEANKAAGGAAWEDVVRLKSKEEELYAARKDQDAVRREREAIAHKKRLQEMEEEIAKQREFFEVHKDLWQQQQDRENGKRQNRVDAIANALGGGPQQPGGLPQAAGGDGAAMGGGRAPKRNWMQDALGRVGNFGGGQDQGPFGNQQQLAAQARNPVQQFIDALDPRRIGKAILDQKLKELAEDRAAALGGLQGKAADKVNDQFNRRERLVRQDVQNGVVGGRGGINQGDVQKAQQDELAARVGLVAQQQKWGGDLLQGFLQAGQNQIEQANILQQQQQQVKRLEAQMAAAMDMLKRVPARR